MTDAALKGIKEGDIVLKAGNEAVSTPQDVAKAVKKAQDEGLPAVMFHIKKSGDQTVLVTTETVIRHGSVLFTLAELNEGDRVHVRATRVQASEAGEAGLDVVESLQATEIKLQNPVGGDDEEQEQEEEATPTRLGGAGRRDRRP